MGAGDIFLFFKYRGDDGSDYVVKLSESIASQGGFATTTLEPGVAVWPYNSRSLRHVWGVAPNGKRTRLPIAQPDDTKFVDGGTFVLHSLTYTIQGAVGEARRASEIGG